MKKRKKIIGLILSALMVMGMLPLTAFAADPPALSVNGVDILASENNTVQCGSGTAVYDPATTTLTLNGAQITAPGQGIVAENIPQLNLVLEGKNSIKSSETTEIHQGVFTMDKLAVTGSGSLDVVTKTTSQGYIVSAFYAWKGCSVSGVTLNFSDISADEFKTFVSCGVDVNEFASSFVSDKATINISGFKHGINVPSNDVTVKNGSELTVTNANRGISGGNEKDNFSIQNSTVTCTVTGENALGLLSGKTITIDNSKVSATSTTSNAVYTDSDIKIINKSEVEVKGYYPALWGTSGISISGSKVIATSDADAGIYTQGNLSITDNSNVAAKGLYAGLRPAGNLTVTDSIVDALSTKDIAVFSNGSVSFKDSTVHAKGADGFAAIAARAIKSGNDSATAKLSSNLIEKNEGKAVFSDWFEFTLDDGSKQTRSWSSFVAKDATGLVVENGKMTNALNEVWLNHNYSKDFTVDIAATCTQEGSKSRHCADCNAVTEVTAISMLPHTPGEWIVDKAPSKTEAGSQHKECTVCQTIVDTQVIPMLPSKDVIVDETTGATGEYADGTKFDSNVTLSVTPKTTEDLKQYGEAVDKAAKGSVLAGLYDVKLLKDGAAVQPDGTIRISLELSKEMKAMTDLQVVYIDDDGNVTIIPSKVVDGKIVFETDHFSQYGVIGKVKTDKTPETADSSTGVMLTGSMLLLSAGAVLTLCRKRGQVR